MVSNSHHTLSLFKIKSKLEAGGRQRWTSLPWVSIYLLIVSQLTYIQVHSVPVMHGDVTGVNLELV